MHRQVLYWWIQKETHGQALGKTIILAVVNVTKRQVTDIRAVLHLRGNQWQDPSSGDLLDIAQANARDGVVVPAKNIRDCDHVGVIKNLFALSSIDVKLDKVLLVIICLQTCA
jgi:hypothetical protein